MNGNKFFIDYINSSLSNKFNILKLALGKGSGDAVK